MFPWNHHLELLGSRATLPAVPRKVSPELKPLVPGSTAMSSRAPSQPTRSQLRRQLRRARRELDVPQQRRAARLLDRQIARSGLLARHRDVAFYLANDGEIDPERLIHRVHRMGKRCYLPVLVPGNRLWFVRYRPGDRLEPNRLGIPEPVDHRDRRPPWALGLVLVPLVGFDRRGSRLGMGGGFYDRSFSYFNRLPAMRRPLLAGVAHSCQELDHLPVESWDIPLALIATEKELIRA